MATLELRASPQPVILDYRGATKLKDVLRSISGVAADGESLWTVSDECRTVERLHRMGDGYGGATSLSLDNPFSGLPGIDDEADLEGLDAVNGRLWLCGSHSHSRAHPLVKGTLNPEISPRPSRNLLGAIATGAGSSYVLPFKDDGSLRQRLRDDALLKPFMDLPTKENGLDIEGLAVFMDRLLLGLRGPVIGGSGLIVELQLHDGSVGDQKPALHTLEMDGLGIRDLARWGDDVIVLAGPVTSADGPFRLYLWRPPLGAQPQSVPERFYCWPAGHEHPEGICRLKRASADGLLVVYDSPDDCRIVGSTYRADWFEVIRR